MVSMNGNSITIRRSIKGMSRAYRRVLRELRINTFPLRGAFHVRTAEGRLLQPENVIAEALVTDIVLVSGPAPVASTSPVLRRLDDNYYGDGAGVEGRDPLAPTATEAPDNLPALPEMFSRSERVGSDGKKRIDYRKVKNPKPSLSYWVKRAVNGKSRYVELSFAKIVNGEQVEASEVA